MTQELYRTPLAEIDEWIPGAAAGTGTFEIGRCLSEAWHATWQNLFPWLGALALVNGGLLVLAALFAGLLLLGFPLEVPLLAGLLTWLLIGPAIAWGFVRFGLNAIDGRARAVDVAAGLPAFGAILVPMIGVCLGMFAASLPGSAAQQLLAATSENPLVRVAALLVPVLWGSCVVSRLYFAPIFLVDFEDELGPAQCIALSWRATRGSTLRCAGLALVALAISIAGLLVLIVGLIPASLMTSLLWTSAYRQRVGRPESGASGYTSV